MLAFWTFYWTALNSHAPYLDLPSIGWDPYQQRSGRGFEQNRYRGNRLFYLESEYRRDITPNGLLGFVLFANLNSVSEPVSDSFEYLHPAAGGGLRIKFNKHSGTNLALDYGLSKGYSAFYLNLGETF
jgi:hemolysin activation/secretion protein